MHTVHCSVTFKKLNPLRASCEFLLKNELCELLTQTQNKMNCPFSLIHWVHSWLDNLILEEKAIVTFSFVLPSFMMHNLHCAKLMDPSRYTEHPGHFQEASEEVNTAVTSSQRVNRAAISDSHRIYQLIHLLLKKPFLWPHWLYLHHNVWTIILWFYSRKKTISFYDCPEFQ